MLLACALFLCVFAFLYLAISPRPIIFWLRRKMSGEAPLKYPGDYEEDGSVIVQENLTYLSEYGRNHYDLYLPNEGKRKFPVIIWIHGGAFIAGGKGGVRNWGMMLAREGYVVAAPDYEYAPEAAYPAQPRQMQEFIQELVNREKAGEPLDMGHICLAGDSAGAHIAAQCALSMVNAEFARETKIEPVLHKDCLKAVLLYCGPYDVGTLLDTNQKFLRFPW